MNVYQSCIAEFIPGAWRLSPNTYWSNNLAVRRRYTRELPGERYMFDEVVNFAYQYTPENAIRHFGLASQEVSEE